MPFIQRQMRRIYTITLLGSLQFAGACWVALLAARGFTLTQIGLAEMVLHLASFLFEVPSGVIADVFGRRRCMIASQCLSAAASAAMALAGSMGGVCIGMALTALSYNFASGAREALAYETLKQQGREADYEHFAVNDATLWRLGSSAATLCAGAALWLGPRAAYGVDFTLALLGLWPALRLQEPDTARPAAGSISRRVAEAIRESGAFLVRSPRAWGLMLGDAAVGAAATMLLYLLQARLPALGLPAGWLGPVLFLLGLGSTLGLQLARFAGRLPYWVTAVLCGGGVLLGVLLACGSWLPAVLAGGFLAGMLDDLLDVRSDVVLNQMVPSSQRATLVSVSSLTFSLVMLGVAPLMGALFGAL